MDAIVFKSDAPKSHQTLVISEKEKDYVRWHQLILELGNLSWVRFSATSLKERGGKWTEKPKKRSVRLFPFNIFVLYFDITSPCTKSQLILDHRIEHTYTAFFTVYFLGKQLVRKPTVVKIDLAR